MYRFRVCRLAFTALGIGLLLALVPVAGVGAQSPYPPNTVVTTYVDARYCGDGSVSVVTDATGDLINVCTSNGVRIYPVGAAVGPSTAPIYNPALPGGVPYTAFNPAVPVAAPYTVPPYATGNGYLPTGYATGGYNNGTNGSIIRQYNDGNSNCPNGDVTQTTSGFYCTATGAPAAATGGIPTYNTGYVPSYNAGYAPAANYGYAPPASGYGGMNGTVIRQYNDGNTNCPNGDVTQTTSGFYCTANGAPAARVR